MDSRRINFRLLQVFRAVVQAGSISQAARQLHLTQPTVSLQLKSLRDIVGEPLLETHREGITLTPAGEYFYQAAGDVLGRFDDLGQQLQRFRGGEVGKLTIGLVTTAKYLVAQLLSSFAEQFPDIEVILNIANRGTILERFRDQADDLYWFSHPPTGTDVDAEPLVRNPLQLIAPPNHWAAGQTITFSQLHEERFLIREPGSATRMLFEAWLSGQGFGLRQTMQIESNEAIRLGVASGLGLAVISEHPLAHGAEQVATLKIKGFPLQSYWYLVRHRQRYESYAAHTFVSHVRERLPQIIESRWLVPTTEA
ncbi:LysR family transcriptional regulator [Pseudidiomarina aestuarii]|uniref:LysR family transcriptional regulator n=1 Tax=Pseudidiomarina aestuarii TaxID=624146 RepID=A0A7Z6ZSC0_9GAMM|nr:LysR family transcriptional regulator [Pseudidiomarina aestuarii]RUO39480.1 LysR family transcriptional regulator [Pseudidiomarina aestuarii]